MTSLIHCYKASAAVYTFMRVHLYVNIYGKKKPHVHDKASLELLMYVHVYSCAFVHSAYLFMYMWYILQRCVRSLLSENTSPYAWDDTNNSHAYMPVHMYTRRHTCVYTYIHFVPAYTHTQYTYNTCCAEIIARTQTSMHTHMKVCIHTSMYALYIHTCTHIQPIHYTYIHAHTFSFRGPNMLRESQLKSHSSCWKVTICVYACEVVCVWHLKLCSAFWKVCASCLCVWMHVCFFWGHETNVVHAIRHVFRAFMIFN